MSIALAIDIGTSSAKALAVDNTGSKIYTAQESYATDYPEPDYAEQDPDEIFEAVKKIIQACPTEIKKNISAISFSSAMHSILAVDKTGAAITPLILWSDLRSKEESNALLESDEGVTFALKTGTPVHPMSPLCKLLWLKKNKKEIFKQAHKFIGIKEFIWYRFFGCFEIDHGIASATGMFETGKLVWHQPVLIKLGIKESQLSKPVSVYHHIALIDSIFLAELGFQGPVKFIIGSSDGCLANLGSNAMDVNTLSVTIGTSGAVRRVVPIGKTERHEKVFCYHLDENTLIEGGATNNGALLLEWFSKKFLNQITDIESFIQRAVKIPAGAEGLIFLPYVFGERAPLYNPEASGAFFGMRQHHSIDHCMRALLEGIGFALFSIAELIESRTGPYSTITASGGFSKSDQWIQMIATIFGKPVRIHHIENASALGAAIIGFKAIGESFSFSSQPSKVFNPDLIVHEKYKKIFSKYQKLSACFFSTMSLG